MFKKGDVLIVQMSENGTETDYYNLTVISCEDGLLAVDAGGTPTVYNMRSLNFIKASLQDQPAGAVGVSDEDLQRIIDATKGRKK